MYIKTVSNVNNVRVLSQLDGVPNIFINCTRSDRFVLSISRTMNDLTQIFTKLIIFNEVNNWIYATVDKRHDDGHVIYVTGEIEVITPRIPQEN